MKEAMNRYNKNSAKNNKFNALEDYLPPFELLQLLKRKNVNVIEVTPTTRLPDIKFKRNLKSLSILPTNEFIVKYASEEDTKTLDMEFFDNNYNLLSDILFLKGMIHLYIKLPEQRENATFVKIFKLIGIEIAII